MRAAWVIVTGVVVVACSTSGPVLGNGNGKNGPPPPPGPPGCGLGEAAFCDTFDSASPGGNAGDLDDAEWSPARIQGSNLGQQEYNALGPTTMEACGVTTPNVPPGKDFSICAGGGEPSMHLNMSYDDHGGFVVQSLRIRRPFDFTGRTGTIVFDVDGKSQTPGGHGWWFNVFISEEPVPAPYQDGGAIALFAKAGVGIEFEGICSGDEYGICKADVCYDAQNKPNDNGCINGSCYTFNGRTNRISNIFFEKDYKVTQSGVENNMDTGILSDVGCFATDNEVLNHFEIKVSTTKIEIFASDAGKPSTLRKVATASNFTLPFSKGYVNIQQAHYNANKGADQCAGCTSPSGCNCPITHSYSTFHWDNVGFDGPKYPTPRAYPVPDDNSGDNGGGTNTGWNLDKAGMNRTGGKPLGPITLANVNLDNATDALITFNAWLGEPGETIGYRLNGGTWRTFTPPWDTTEGGARAVLIPVDLADMKSGNNTLELNSKSGTAMIANLELTVNVK